MEQIFSHSELYNKDRQNLIELLKNDRRAAPNEFTIGIGNLIKKAREERGINQTQLADKISRRQATISDIENGKIEIGVITLVLISLELNKPVSYFIPPEFSLGSMNAPGDAAEEELLLLYRDLKQLGETALVLKILKALVEFYAKDQNSSTEQF